MRHLVITRSHKIIGEKSRQDFEIFVVEGPRRSLCSDNRAPDGKKLEGEKSNTYSFFASQLFSFWTRNPIITTQKYFVPRPSTRQKTNTYSFFASWLFSFWNPIITTLKYFGYFLKADFHYTKIFWLFSESRFSLH